MQHDLSILSSNQGIKRRGRMMGVIEAHNVIIGILALKKKMKL